MREMFDDIAPRYDLLNSLLSAGIHRRLADVRDPMCLSGVRAMRFWTSAPGRATGQTELKKRRRRPNEDWWRRRISPCRCSGTGLYRVCPQSGVGDVQGDATQSTLRRQCL